MALDRDELAARFAVALACGDIASDQPERAPVDVVATRAFEYADAFVDEAKRLAALHPAPVAPVAAPAGKYAPAVGDVVRVSRPWTGHEWMCFLDADWHNREDFGIVVPTTDFCRDSGKVSVVRASGSRRDDVHGVEAERLAFVRPATPAELAAAGLPATPAPEAKRPTWVRITGPADADNVTVGKAYAVTAWDKDGCPKIVNDRGGEWFLPDPSDREYSSSWPSWEPATPPAIDAGEARAERIERAAANLSARLVDARHYTESGDAKYDSGWGVDEAHQRLIEAIEVARKCDGKGE